MEEEFGLLIRFARQKKEWTADQLIQKTGRQFSRTYLTKIERSDEIPQPDLTIKIAQALDLDVDLLMCIAKKTLVRRYSEKIDRIYKQHGF